MLQKLGRCVVVFVVLTLSVIAQAHEAKLDGDGGHLEDLGFYHFHNEDGSYEQSPAEIPDVIVGPWVFTVIPAEVDTRDSVHIREDALAAYTDGTLTETSLAGSGIEARDYEGIGWRVDWEIGFLKEKNRPCQHNIPEVAGHLALLEGGNYFYAVLKFQSTHTTKSSIHLNYNANARAWLNGVEFLHSPLDMWGNAFGIGDDEEFPPEYPQALVRKGENLLVVKVGRGDNNCGNAPMWYVTCGIQPHETADIQPVGFYQDGKLTVDYYTTNPPGSPSVKQDPVLTTWAALKRR